MRRKIISFLCVLCLALTMCTTVFAAEGDTEKGSTKLSLTAELNKDNTQVSVTVAITETTPVPGIQFDVNYDPAKVQYADVEYGTMFDTPASNPAYTDSSVRLVSFMSQGNTEETGPVATFTFDVKDGVTGDVSFSVTNLKVSKAESTINPSEVTVTIPAAQPTPTTEPTTKPTTEPTVEPTTKPTTEPTDKPTTEPTDKPTTEPTDKPTTEPTTTPASSDSSTSSQAPNATTNPDEAPSTGDTTNVTLYIVLALVCVAAMGGVVVYRRKVTH